MQFLSQLLELKIKNAFDSVLHVRKRKSLSFPTSLNARGKETETRRRNSRFETEGKNNYAFNSINCIYTSLLG